MSREVQRERLQDRLDRPQKRWKIPLGSDGKIGDIEVHKHYTDWVTAREPILARTSTWWAPWHVIPADREYYRNLAAVKLVREAMQKMGLHFPSYPQLDGVKVPK